MKLSILLISLILGISYAKVQPAERNSMLDKNRTPKERAEKNYLGKKTPKWMDTCSECKEIVKRIGAILQDPSKIAEMKMMLNIMCDVLPEQYRSECKGFVSELDTLIEELKPLLKDPEAVCKMAHLCNGRRGGFNRLALLYAKKYLNTEKVGTGKNDILCDECQFAMTELKTLVDDKSIQDQMKAALHQICHYMGSLAQDCGSLVDEYFPVFISELDSLLAEPKTVCSEIGLCNSHKVLIKGARLTPSSFNLKIPHLHRTSASKEFLQRLRRVQTKSGSKAGCAVCVYGLGAVLRGIKADKPLLESWVNSVKEICPEMPRDIQPGCLDFLNIYMKPVIVMTIDEINAKEVCRFIHACDASRQALMSGSNNILLCESCQLLVHFVKSEFNQESFQHEIAQEVEQICPILPVSRETQITCDSVVQQFVPYVIQAIGTVMEPKEICQEARMCDANQSQLGTQ